jgi:2',3'-cyclic-nucleotide 2'-phosphodiesterase (5'-nucleotidase family)
MMTHQFRLPKRIAKLSVGLLVFLLPLGAQPKQITILHTNDMHASFLPHQAFWVKTTPKPLVGGFNELAFAIDSIRNIRTATLVLDAGDLMTGNPITDRVYNGAEGGALVEMMNLIGYEGMTPGNHDFDISYANFLKLVAIAKFPVVSANLIDEKSGEPVTQRPYVILQKNGLKIGIFGLMSSDFYDLVSQHSTEGIKLLPPVPTAEKYISLLRPRTDLVIAITHQGVQDDSVLAVSVKGLDVIIGGHSHTRLRKPKYINGVIIAQTGSNCENLGVLDLTVEHGHVTKWDGSLHQLWYNPSRQKTVATALVDSFKIEIDKEYSQIIGTLKDPWKISGWETGAGNFIADAQREVAHADIAFMNNGGIRKNLSPGPITKQDLFEVLPFRNVLTTFEVSGRQIREIVKHDIEKKPDIQVSGIRCEWRRDPSGRVEIVKLLVGGKPVDDKRMYVGAASDYLMGGAKRYLGIDQPKLTYLNETVFNAVLKKILAMKEVTSPIEGRIKQVKQPRPAP